MKLVDALAKWAGLSAAELVNFLIREKAAFPDLDRKSVV